MKIAMPNGNGNEIDINQFYNLRNEAVKKIGIPKASVMANLLCIDMHIEGYAVKFYCNGMLIRPNQPADDYYRDVVSNATSFLVTEVEPIKTTTRECRSDTCETCGSTRRSRSVGEYRKNADTTETLINCSDCHL